MKKLIVTAMLAVSLFTASAQEFNQTEAIKNQLSDIEVTQLQNAEDQTSKADGIMEGCASKQAQADKLKSQAASMKKGKAKKILKQAETIETPLIAQKINAYNIYEKANGTTYGIYASNLKDLKAAANENKQVAAESLIDDATSSWTSAASTLKKVPTDKKADQKQVVKLKEEANRLQKEAISLQIQAYAILLGWFDKEETEPTPAPVVEEESIQAVEKTDRIIFKVQIAASYDPLSLDKLRKIYPSKEIINNELDGKIYRYSVGYYSSYDEAASAIKKMGVQGAFVVGYRNGKRVKDINEVLPNN